MISTLHPPSAEEGLSELWAISHRDTAIALADSEIHLLTCIALTLDDEMASQLLLKKLRLAKRMPADELPEPVARMNSFVEFDDGGTQKRICQLLHPSAPPTSGIGLSISSLVGIGLIGLHAGQSVLWPVRDGTMGALAILRVENRTKPARLATHANGVSAGKRSFAEPMLAQ